MSEGGKAAVRADDDVVAASEVRRLEERVRELERLRVINNPLVRSTALGVARKFSLAAPKRLYSGVDTDQISSALTNTEPSISNNPAFSFWAARSSIINR